MLYVIKKAAEDLLFVYQPIFCTDISMNVLEFFITFM